jgi:transglutaminase-like putative cysteine protease
MTRSIGSVRLPVMAAVATLTSAICLGPTFLTAEWFFPSLFAVVFVGVGSEVARRLSTTRAAVPLGGLTALLLYLLVRYGHPEAWLHVVPTTGSLQRLSDLAAAGGEDIERYAAPIGVSPGVQLLTVGGIGLVALAVDTLAVTYRRAALAGLPLLALYTVPTAVAPEGVNWLAFAIGGTGFLALLLAESRERVNRWGRPMRQTVARAGWRPDADTAPLSQVGRRVGATALGLALVVPAVLPDVDGLSGVGFGDGGFGFGGGGRGTVSVLNPIVDLGKNLRRPENRPVIEYAGRPTYLRLVALDEFDGRLWRPSELKVSREDNDVEDGLSSPPGLDSDVKTQNRRYRIAIGELDQEWLPLPYPTRRVAIDGTWLYDPSTFNVFGENRSTLGIEYDVRASFVSPTVEQLRAAGEAPGSLSRYLELPADLPFVVEETMEEVVGDRVTAYDKMLAIQDWLRDPREFTYSTEVSDTIGDANGSDAIAGFLQTRMGYCVHFASTMAVMARLLDVPARVAIGFTAGTPNGSGGRIVGLHDAHAWPELYFEGTGWVAFEPTPAERTGSPPPWARADVAAGGSGGAPTAAPTPGAQGENGQQNPRAAEGRLDAIDAAEQGRFLGGGQIGAGPVQVPVVPLLIAAGVLLLLAVPAATRAAVRRRRWHRAQTPAEQARAAWADLQDTLLDFGYRWSASDPPRRGVARLVAVKELDPPAAEAAGRLARATEQERYAPVMSQDVGDLRGDVDAVRAALAAGGSRWTRWRARLLPRSARAVSTAVAERIADGLDAVDAGLAGVSNRLRLRRT